MSECDDEMHEIFEDIYNRCADKLEPYIDRIGKMGFTPLPASISDSLDIVIEHWIATVAEPRRHYPVEIGPSNCRLLVCYCGNQDPAHRDKPILGADETRQPR